MALNLPSLNALRAFEATARLGSVNRAANELHVTHGAISRQIKHLEEQLGCALFQREGRGLTLTPTGRSLSESTSDALNQLSAACHRAKQQHKQGALTLGCSASVLARWIIPRLARLETEMPALRLHLSPQENTPDSRLNGLDAALLLETPPWPSNWKVYDLGVERIGPVLAPTHAAAGYLLTSGPEALLSLPLLQTASRPQAWPDWANQHQLPLDALQLGACFDHLYYLLEAAVSGLGVAIAPEPLVQEDLRAGRLIAPWGFTNTSARWVLSARKENADPRLDALASWLSRALSDT